MHIQKILNMNDNNLAYSLWCQLLSILFQVTIVSLQSMTSDYLTFILLTILD